MGVADITLSQAITPQLNQQELSIANLEEQVSSGRSLNKPSDNPAAVTQVLQLSSQASQLSNWQANTQTADLVAGHGEQRPEQRPGRHAERPDADPADPQPGDPERDDLSGRGPATPGDQRRPALHGQHPVRGPADLRRHVGIDPGLRRRRATTWATPTRPMWSSAPAPASGQTAALSVPGPSVFGTGAASVFNTLTTVIGQLGSGAPTATQLNAALERARRQHQHRGAGRAQCSGTGRIR